MGTDQGDRLGDRARSPGLSLRAVSPRAKPAAIRGMFPRLAHGWQPFYHLQER